MDEIMKAFTIAHVVLTIGIPAVFLWFAFRQLFKLTIEDLDHDDQVWTARLSLGLLGMMVSTLIVGWLGIVTRFPIISIVLSICLGLWFLYALSKAIKLAIFG